MIAYHLKKPACLAKVWFGSYDRRTVSGNVKNCHFSTFDLFFIRFLDKDENAGIFSDRNTSELHPYQISGHFDHF